MSSFFQIRGVLAAFVASDAGSLFGEESFHIVREEWKKDRDLREVKRKEEEEARLRVGVRLVSLSRFVVNNGCYILPYSMSCFRCFKQTRVFSCARRVRERD